MAHFPALIDLTEKTVLIVGDSPEAEHKARILAPFGPRIRFLSSLCPKDLDPIPALVVLTGENRDI